MSSGFFNRRLTSPTPFEEWPSVDRISGGFLADTYLLLFAPAVEHHFELPSMNDYSTVAQAAQFGMK